MERPFRNVPEPHRGAVGDRAPGQPGGEEVARVDTAAADQAAEDAIRELFWRGSCQPRDASICRGCEPALEPKPGRPSVNSAATHV